MRYLHLPGDDGVPRLTALIGDRVVDLADATPGVRSIDDLARSATDVWERTRIAARDRIEGSALRLPTGPLPPPLARPSKIVVLGAARRDGAARVPTVTAKFPSVLAGPGMAISWPTDISRRVDGRAKLGVIVGRPLRRASPDECLEGVFGYTVANDLTARDVQESDGQWTRSKNLDGFCPIGPLVVTAEECPAPQDLRIATYINSVLVQESNAHDLSLPVAELLSFASQSFTLYPGDLVLTGAVDHVAAWRDRPAFLSPGDEITVSIEGIGDLTNPVLPYL